MKRLSFFLVCLAVLSMLVVPVVSLAGDCFVGSCRQRVILPVYRKNVLVPIRSHYVAPVKVQKVYVAPHVVPVHVNPETYSSVNDYYRDKLLVDAIVGRLLQLQQQGLLQPGALQNGGLNPGLPLKVPGLPAHDTNDQAQVKLAPIVGARCISCHSDTKPLGDLSLSDLRKIPKGTRWQMHGLVSSGEMPKGKNAVPDEEVPPFYDFAKSSN